MLTITRGLLAKQAVLQTAKLQIKKYTALIKPSSRKKKLLMAFMVFVQTLRMMYLKLLRQITGDGRLKIALGL